MLTLALALLALQAPSDALEAIRARGAFTWGADEEGGGPYLFPDPAEPSRRIGFEVELADALALELTRELGAPIAAQFAQGPWDKLPDLLKTGRIDLVLNGYEWTPERARDMAATLPYYVFELQLLTRADAAGASWEWLASAPPKQVGVLGGSSAESYLAQRCPTLELVSYDGNTNAMGDVVSGRLDATLQDLPIALFYRAEFPELAFTGAPVAPGRYVIYVRRGEQRLHTALDRALLALRTEGTLRAIDERYGIWTAAQENTEYLSLPAASDEAAVEAGFFARYGVPLLESAGMTVLLSLLSFPLAILLGLGIALGRLYGPRLVAWPLTLYVEVLRGTPLMLQLFVLFYVLPNAGLELPALGAAVLGLAVNYSAYEAEIYRAGLQAVPVGQMEAALVLGMSRRLALRRVVVPQAVRIVVPAVTNDFIALFKDTSVCSVITVVELTKRYNIAAMTHPSDVLPLAAMAAVLYLVMSYPLSLLSARLERALRA
ncbi:MAG: transporter substrate-binding domain-containing protein [Planctomycetes bacterium]|nr:transporter substrate-binding domain-containing protein [Planctomycetota bacterium]